MIDTSNRVTRRVANLACASALLLAAGACGNVTAGGFTEVVVDVSGDVPDPVPQATLLAAAPALDASATSGPLPSSHDDAQDAEGEVEVDFTLALITESGGVVPLGQDDIRVKIDLQGVDEAEAVKELIPAWRYTGLRITFTHIKVEVSGGLVINGQPVIGEIRVELEGPDLVVTRTLDLDAIEGDTVTLLMDLNTRAWLEAVDPVTLTVDPAVFASLINLVVP